MPLEPNLSKKNNVISVDFGKRKNTITTQDEPKINEEKLSLFRNWLEYQTVALILDASLAGVIVPPEFMGQINLKLNFNYQFYVPDFDFDEKSVWATLSFDSGHYFCRIPWTAVYVMECPLLKKSISWPEHYPKASIADNNK